VQYKSVTAMSKMNAQLIDVWHWKANTVHVVIG